MVELGVGIGDLVQVSQPIVSCQDDQQPIQSRGRSKYDTRWPSDLDHLTRSGHHDQTPVSVAESLLTPSTLCPWPSTSISPPYSLAFGMAWPSQNTAYNAVELDSTFRENCQVVLGGIVMIKRFDVDSFPILDSHHIILKRFTSTPSNQSIGCFGQGKHQSALKDLDHTRYQPHLELLELFLRQRLLGQYICTGLVIVVAIYGVNTKFQIQQITSLDSKEYRGIFRVTSNAVVKVALGQHDDVEGKAARPTSHTLPLQPSEVSPLSSISYSEVGGLSAQIQELRELIELPLTHPKLFLQYGLKPPRGVLLYGPPGTGKTLLAQVLARSTGAKFFTLSAPEIMSKYYGESENKLLELFQLAQAQAPSIIFIDEIDAIAPKRDISESQVSKRIVSTLLTLMDGIHSREMDLKTGLIVLAATNRPNAIDPALRRPGRFDREIEIPIPNESQRLEILQIYLLRMGHNLDSCHISKIASLTHGYVGADLSNLCKEAGLNTLRRFNYGKEYEKQELQKEKQNGHVGGDISNDAQDSPRFVDSTMNQSTQKFNFNVTIDDFLSAMAEIRPSTMREVMVDIPKVKWDDIGGYDQVKQRIKAAVEWPLQYPEAFQRMGIEPSRGILLYGPPGCSKTLLAKAVATEAKLNFIPIKGPELFSKYVGDSEKAVREVFRKARAASPSIIFFDEIDAIGGERGLGSDGNSVHDRVLAQMLNELDGIEPLRNVLFLAATNRPDIIDRALMRPGRIDKIIYVGPPDYNARIKILQIQLNKIPHDPDIDLNELAKCTDGLSGAELTCACREACLSAMEEDMNVERVKQVHFLNSIKQIHPGITPETIQFYENFSTR